MSTLNSTAIVCLPNHAGLESARTLLKHVKENGLNTDTQESVAYLHDNLNTQISHMQQALEAFEAAVASLDEAFNIEDSKAERKGDITDEAFNEAVDNAIDQLDEDFQGYESM